MLLIIEVFACEKLNITFKIEVGFSSSNKEIYGGTEKHSALVSASESKLRLHFQSVATQSNTSAVGILHERHKCSNNIRCAHIANSN